MDKKTPKEGDEPSLQEHWYLVDTHGQKFRLPKTMLFLGREECDVVVASQSVDKRHAVLTFDLYLNRFKVKDLSTTNGTYVNNSRIAEQEYVTLNHMDSVRLGHDAMMYHVEQGSQITNQGGQLPDPSFVPAWASRHHHLASQQQQQQHQQQHYQSGEQLHMHAHAMAECQGCIAEQHIEHSCSLREDLESSNDPQLRTSTTSSPRHHNDNSNSSNQRRASPASNKSSSLSSLSSTSHQNRSPLSSDSDHLYHNHPSQYEQHKHSPLSQSQQNDLDIATDHDRSHYQRTNDVTECSASPSRKQQNKDQSPRLAHENGCKSSGDDDALTTNTDNDKTSSHGNTVDDVNTHDDVSAATLANTAASGGGRNTWPRKRPRPGMPHVSTLFSHDGDVTEEDANGAASTSEVRPAGVLGGMYFVAFDDSLCNSSNMPAAGSIADLKKRRPRNSHNNPINPELTTVKKGTPLYGQPSWWGDDNDKVSQDEVKAGSTGEKVTSASDAKDKGGGGGKKSRPNSLGLSEDEADPSPTKVKDQRSAQPNGRMNGERRIKPTYMEIPFTDDVDNEQQEGSNSGLKKKASCGANASATSTPAKSISSSLSRDSLIDSPDVKPVNKSSDEKAPTSFTVDLSDPADPQTKLTKPVTMAASLSQYVPSKIRRGFRDRQDRAGSHSKLGSSSRGSTPSKTSEERELSPAHQQKNKLEEIWSVVEGGSSKPSRQSTRLSSTQATAGSITSLRSPNLDEIERLSGDDKTRGQKKSSMSPQATRASKTRTSTQLKQSPAGVAATVSQYPDSTSYLIDKMFECGSSSSGIGGSVAGSSVSSAGDSDLAPEKCMYSEAAGFDRTRKSAARQTAGRLGKPTERSGGAPPLSAARRRSSGSSAGRPTPFAARKPSGGAGKNVSTSKPSNSIANRGVCESLSCESPDKVCDNNDSDDDNSNILVDDDLQITEDEIDKASSSIVSSALAVAGEDGETSDKASEAGTYVIEAEGEEGEGEEEEEEARRKIDEVFGVDKPHRSSPGGYDNVDYDDDENDLTVGANDVCDGEATPLDGHSPLDDDDCAVEEPNMAATEGVQTWMSQLNALTNSHRKLSLSADDKQMAKEEGETSLARKPPASGVTYSKRPGTGRKLPSIPTTDRSPVSSEHSSCVLDPEVTGHILDEQAGWSAASSQRVVNGGHRSAATSNGKVGASHSVVRSHKGPTNGVDKKSLTNGAGSSRQVVSSPGSARSRGSVDTELLLQDTETVMAAMEARMAYRTAGRQGSGDSDTDVSSTVALVNGDEDYVKPSYYTSPRDALTRSAADRRLSGLAATRSGASNIAASSKRGTTMGKSYSQTIASKSRTPSSSNASPRTPTSSSVSQRRSVGSDIYSGRDSVGADSIASDQGSDAGTIDGSFSRSGSRGKGTITMTKPNRAFQLRRARSDSVEENGTPITPRSAKSGLTSSRTGASARSSSVHSTNRSRSGLDTNRSEATSLGAQIARKSRANGATINSSVGDSRTSNGVAQKASSSSNLHRQDGGRHSLRLTRASSLTISSPGGQNVSSSSSAHNRRDLSKPHVRTTPTNVRGGLAVTGVSAAGDAMSVTSSSRSQSQPGSRSNTPKAAERQAWKRRKEYDPRRAVAEAKAKAKETTTHHHHHSGSTVTMRPKPHANARNNRRMIRSASFTNTGGSLALSLSGSVSASQEIGPPTGSTDMSGDSGAFRRSFLPFQGRLGAQSADEDETSPSSIRASYDTLIVSSIHQLSMKLVSNTDRSLQKLRDQSRASHSPSPCEDFLGSGGRGEIKAFRSANQELAGVLSNLRRLERHVQVMNSVLFPEDEVPTRLSTTGSLPSPSSPTSISTGPSSMGTGRQGKQKYFAEIERIRSELAGFHPIGGAQVADTMTGSEVDSPEMAELSEQF